jgi:signal transduction histidine kinase
VDALSTLRRRERIIAAVRWLALLFALAHVVLYEPPIAGLEASAVAARPRGFVLAGSLALIGVAAEAAIRLVRTPGALRRVGAAMLAADVVVGLAFVSVYAFDQAAAAWAMLTLLPLEGALRFQLRGALASWAVIAPMLALRDLLAGEVAFSPGRTIYRLALLLAVAAFAGTMARDLERQQRLSSGVAEASRQLLGRLEPAEILRVLCREAVRCLGARSAVVYVHDGQWFQAVSSWPAEALPVVLAQDLAEDEDPNLAAHVTTSPVWLEPDDTHPGRLAIPLRAPGQSDAHVLVIRPLRPLRFSAVESQAAASLAEAAALALATTRVLTTEQQTTRRLRYLEALRTRFVATVAHDLRLPLTVFKGVAALLRTRRDAIATEQVDEMLESVERQANRLSRLADDLLDAARMDADKLTLHPESTDLAKVIAAIEADSEEDVEVDLAGDLSLVADPARLERVLWNLLSNAEKYGKPPFTIGARRDGADVVVSVRDHGTGLSEAQRGRLFSEFAGSDDAASVGLGLAIVWRLVDAHGGSVHYEDAEPGARFVVRLPAEGPSGD